MKKENTKNGFLITWVSCIVFLLMLCFLGINGNVKGTYSATKLVCSCPNGGTLSGKTCIVSEPTKVTETMSSTTGSCPRGTGSCTYSGNSTYSCTCTYEVGNRDSYDASCTYVPIDDDSSSDSTSYACYLSGGLYHWVSTSSVIGQTGSKVSASSKSACEALNDSDDDSSSDSTSYACYLSGGLYHWVSTSSVIGQTGSKVSASSKSACEALNDSDDDKKCTYLSEGHCKGVTGRDCVYGADGCWYAASASGTVPSRSCTEEFGNVVNGYWAGMCETVQKTDGTYEFVCQKGNNCQLACVSGYTLENGSCVKCEDCEPCENPACYYNSSTGAYAWGVYEDGSGWKKTDLSQDKCVNSKPSNSTPSSSKPSSSTPSSSIPSNPKPSSSNNNVTENPQTGQIAMFIIWIIGLAAVVYSVWYFRNIKKEN